MLRSFLFSALLFGGVAFLGCGPPCTPKSCGDLGSGGNGKSYQSCVACDSQYGCDISLKDSSGNVFYHCSDTDGKTCSTDSNFVSSEESYCGL